MKKMTAIVLSLTMVFSLGACSMLKEVEGDPAKTGSSSSAAEQPGTVGNAAVVPEMDTALESLGCQVIARIEKHVERFGAPDGTDQTILDFSYDTVTVHVEGNDAASDRINGSLSVLEETFYSGTGMGDGVNGMLEQATDNYTVAVEIGDDRPLEFSSSRSASVRRSDSHILSLVYDTQVYTGGAHGSYHERAYVFNPNTGERLTFSALCDSPELTEVLKSFLLSKMLEQAQDESSGVDLSLFQEEGSLEAALAALIREASWYFDADGLVVFSDIYEIGSYAAGIIYFRFSYQELADYLSAKWLPIEREGGGRLSIAAIDDVPSGTVTILDRVEVDDDGIELCLTANGTVYDVSVISVEYISDEIGFYETAQHWSCSYMHDCAVQIAAVLPQGMPDMMIRCTSADGRVYKYYVTVTQNGEGGTLILSDDSISAVG